ncbi:MAG: hypothetical protein KC502_11535 [Myxococcales bacterium]|nr:hypothetical protein [Myxococcales bacterium]
MTRETSPVSTLLSVILLLIAGVGTPSMAHAASELVGTSVWSAAYGEHPTVNEVRRDGYLTVLTRARVLSDDLPLDRAMAVVSAMTVKQARQFKTAKGIARALRARHSIGPSGALLGKAIPATKLSARESLLLGWARAREAGSHRQKLAVRAPNISGAGALQLLEQAAKSAPDAQAPQLALALVRATVAGKGRKRRCNAFVAVQRAARDSRKASIRLAIAEQAVKSVRKLGRTCSKRVRKPFAVPIKLQTPPAERVRRPVGVGRPGRPNRPSSRTQANGIAFSVVAPVFKGYLKIPLIRQLAQRTRLDEIKLLRLMKKDPTGDATVAALNASVLMRRLAPDDTFDVALQAVLRQMNLLDAPPARLAKLRLSHLSGPQAMALGYCRALQGRGLGKQPSQPNPAVLTASPRQLFTYARQHVPANASLGPILMLAHNVDIKRTKSPCAAREKAESTAFIVRKSALPAATKTALLGAMNAVIAQCKLPTRTP